MDINVKLTIGTTEALETTLRWLGEAVSRLYRVDLATGVYEAKETPALPVKATGDVTEAPRRDAAPQTPQATQAIEPGAKVEPFPENHCPEITDEELLLQANALMKKFSGKEDTRTATDPKSKAVWAQCKVLFKEIARHFGAPMPSKLPQDKRPLFIEALNSVYNEGTPEKPEIRWKPF